MKGWQYSNRSLRIRGDSANCFIDADRIGVSLPLSQEALRVSQRGSSDDATRMSLKKNLMAACSIGVLAAVVTGCSSNDKGVSPELAAAQRQVSDANSALVAARLAAQDAAAEAAAEAAVALAAAEAERDEAQAAATAAGEALTGAIASVIAGFEAAGITLSPEAATGDLDALGADLLAAATALSDANTALAAAMMQADADAMEIASLTQARDDAQTDLAAAMTQAGMDATTISDMMAQIATLTTERDAALEELADLVEDEADVVAQKAIDERIAREVGVRTAIGDSRVDGTTDAAPTMPGTGSDVSGVVVERDADGTVTFDTNGSSKGTGDYDGDEADAGSGDWTSTVLTREDDDAADTIVIYTDIEEPKDQLLTGAGSDDEAGPGGPYAYNRADLDNALRPDVDDGKDYIGNAKSSGFPSGPGVTFTYTGAKDERPLTVEGTFAGVDGVFLCVTSTGCMVGTDGDGDLATTTGEWRFTATSPITATVKDPDRDYTYFGWWLNKPDDEDDPHTVEVFAGRAGEVAITDVRAVEGTARYSGPAVGKYVTKTFTAGVQTDAGVGHFTAEAKLKAVFDADADDTGISGTVDDFILDDTTAAPWEVTLVGDVDFGAVFGNTTGISLTGDKDDRIDEQGHWKGSFYDAGEDEGDAPGTVVGTFDAVTDNAGVIGAFGAKN